MALKKMHLNLPEELKARAVARAKADHVPLAHVMREALRAYLKAEKP